MEVRRYAVGKGEEPEALAGQRDHSPEKAGRPWQGSPQVEGGNGLSSPKLGGTQNTNRREDDAEGPGRPGAKNEATLMGRKAWRRLVRMHGGRELRGG